MYTKQLEFLFICSLWFLYILFSWFPKATSKELVEKTPAVFPITWLSRNSPFFLNSPNPSKTSQECNRRCTAYFCSGWSMQPAAFVVEKTRLETKLSVHVICCTFIPEWIPVPVAIHINQSQYHEEDNQVIFST